MTGKTVLIVEDEAVLAFHLKKQLERMGHVVIPPVATGEEAIEKAGEMQPDLVLMDIKLKGQMDGIEAAEQIRAQFDLPVVYLTAYADADTLDRAAKTDPFGYLVKPFERQELQATIAMALSKHKVEQDLRAAYRQLEEADRLKNEMIDNVAHEFRTPLAYIVGYSGLLLDEELGIGTLSDDQRKYLRIMSRASRRLEWMLKNFVLLQSAEEVVASDKEPLDIPELLAKIADDARLEADAVEVCISLETNGSVPPVMANRMGICQVVDNLITNAIKFTPQGGEIALAASRCPSKGGVCVSVKDTGIGIAEEYHQQIFERFYQIDGSATRRYAGSGLGLALCKEIVEAHGGQIFVESAPGEGATFTFTLPPTSS